MTNFPSYFLSSGCILYFKVIDKIRSYDMFYILAKFLSSITKFCQSCHLKRLAVATLKPSDGLKIDAASNLFITLSPRIKNGWDGAAAAETKFKSF